MDVGTTVLPICNIGQDVADDVLEILDAYPAIDRSAIAVVPEPNFHCILRYDQAGQKQETLLGGVPSLSYARLKRALDCDAVCLDFVTGFEVTLQTLQRLRAATKMPIFMDVHSLTLGIDDQRRRFVRCPEHWQEWLRGVRVAQMNQLEARVLAHDQLGADASIRRFGKEVLGLGCEALVITLGDRGSLTVFRDRTTGLQILPAQAAPAGPVVDVTGCGDAFLAGFSLAYLRWDAADPNSRLAHASRFANRVAGASCALEGIEQIGKIKQLVQSG